MSKPELKSYRCKAPESHMMEDGACQGLDAVCAACRDRECEAPDNQHAMWWCKKIADTCDACEYSVPDVDVYEKCAECKTNYHYLLKIINDIRFACGDNGRAMLDELAPYIGKIAEERDELKKNNGESDE